MLYGAVQAPISQRSSQGGNRVCAAGYRNGRLERPQIQLYPSRLYPQVVALDGEQDSSPFPATATLPERRPEPAQGTAQVRPGAPPIASRPQQLGELPSRVLLPLGRQVAQQRQGLLQIGRAHV